MNDKIKLLLTHTYHKERITLLEMLKEGKYTTGGDDITGDDITYQKINDRLEKIDTILQTLNK